jgi:hypothetical protein
MVTSPRSLAAPLAAVFCSLALVSPVLAQAKTPPAAPATQAQAAPAAPAKWVAPIKGLAHIEVMNGASKKVGGNIVTVTKVKNVSDGAIALLRMDELWYNSKREQVTGDTFVLRRPLMPGEIIEITTKSPVKPDIQQSQYMFSHANGKMDVKRVKTFDEKTKTK